MDIHIGRQTFTVPCRRFSIRLSVTNKERLPLVKEFALRYLFVANSCGAESLQHFFGFTERELLILLKDLKIEGLIEFTGQEVSLSDKAREIFRESEMEQPQIHSVQKWHEKFAIDFISFSIIHFEIRSEGYRSFHELVSPDLEKVSRSKEIAKEVFADSFHEYVERYKSDITNDERGRLSIYGISSIESGDTFSFPLSVDLYVSPDNPKQIEQRYSVFNTEAAQERRRRIVQEVAKTIGALKGQSRFGADLLWLTEEQLGLGFFGQFLRGGRLDIGRTLKQVDDIRNGGGSDLMTVPVAGAFHVEQNAELLRDFVRESTSAIRTENGDGDSGVSECVFWQKPSNEFWGRDDGSYTIIRDIRRSATAFSGTNSELFLVFNSGYEKTKDLKWRLTRKNNRNVFDKGFSTGLMDKMGPVEAFIWPGVIGGVVYYYLEDATWEYPVPLGFLTRDPIVLSRLSKFLFVQWTGYGRKVRQHWPAEAGAERDHEVAGPEVFSALVNDVQVKGPRNILTLRERGP